MTAQTWVLLGVLGVLVTGLLSMVALAFNSLRSEIGARFDAFGAVMDARFTAVDARFDGVDQRFDGVDRRLDALDRHVQALTTRVFRDPG